MNRPLSSSRIPSDSAVAENFWPRHRYPSAAPVSIPAAPRAAANLYEFFVHELSLLADGACQVDQLAHALFPTLDQDQISLRRLVLGLAHSARGCLPDLPSALIDDGVVLPTTHDRLIEVLIRPLDPSRGRRRIAETRSVASARAVFAFTHIAVHFSAALTHAAEDARVLGADRLHYALSGRAAIWGDYLHGLRLQEHRFRAQAYAAGLDTRPCWQTA